LMLSTSSQNLSHGGRGLERKVSLSTARRVG
jgi:hypothetical protein